MRLRHMLGFVFVGVLVGSGCGSDSGGEDGSGAAGGSSGSSGAGATDGSATGGSSGASGGSAGASGGSAGASGGTAGASGGTAGSGGSGGSGGCRVTTCQGMTYKCGDCIDNDNDGKVDMEDPDCLGPCHNAEDTYYGSIPGQAGPACTVDCYFDKDSGSGNDKCYWNHRCDPKEPEDVQGCGYDANANTPGTSSSCSQLSMTQLPECINFCKPLVPNGCDCFGCCELPAGSGKTVWLGTEDANGNPTCDKDSVNDPTKCKPCTQVPGCNNPCAHCELCLGKPTLPADCFPPPPDGGTGGSGGSTGGTGGTGGTNQCDAIQCASGQQACGLPGCPACPSGQFCLTGCCTAVP